MANKKTKHKHDAEDEELLESGLNPETKKGIFVVLLIALGGICLLSLFGLAGAAGGYIASGMAIALGNTKWILPIILILTGYLILNTEKYAVNFLNYAGIVLFILSLNGLIHVFSVKYIKDYLPTAAQGEAGGYAGVLLSYPLQKIMGFWATLIILIALLVIALLITFNTSLHKIGRTGFFWTKLFTWPASLWQRLTTKDEKEESEPEEILELPPEKNKGEESVAFASKAIGSVSADKKEIEEFSQPAKRHRKVDLPLDLLTSKASKPTSGDIKLNTERIQKTLENFGINIEIGEVNVGPTVTQYAFKPADGVKLSQITTLNNDLALALAAHPIRIEAPIPGKSLVGIEVPNKTVALVTMREILESKEFTERNSNLMVALGKDVAGKSWLADVSAMPHMLIAGATGSGKTVCVNSLIISLLYQNGPDTLRFIMVDPKRVELPIYNGIPHLVTPVITEPKKTINALKWAVAEMDRRFEMLAKLGRRDIKSYNKIASEPMPYLVIVIDELADLMAVASSEVEGLIVRLAQMARAVGIHLILATQRPSVDVITGLIKANITTRIAFSVASLIDSRTILDTAGAEKLLGRGDMLFTSAALSKPKRLQGVYISDGEIKNVVDRIKESSDETAYDTTVTENSNANRGLFLNDSDGDELFDEAKEVVLAAGKASSSLLQRRLKVGYARAARLVDLLEEAGIVGPADGAKPREILIEKETDPTTDYREEIPIVEGPREETSPNEFPDIDEESAEEADR